MNTPEWANDPVVVKLRREERNKRILLGKRKASVVEGEASRSGTRGRSRESERTNTFDRDGSTGLRRDTSRASGMSGVPKRVLGKGKAIRRGLSRRL